MRNGQNLKITTLLGSTIPSTPLDVIQRIYRPSTTTVLSFLLLQIFLWPCLPPTAPQEIPPLLSTICNHLLSLLAYAYHMLLYLSICEQLFDSLPPLLPTNKEWLPPSCGSQQHNAPKATKWEALLFSVLKELQKYYLKTILLIYNQLLYLPPLIEYQYNTRSSSPSTIFD